MATDGGGSKTDIRGRGAIRVVGFANGSGTQSLRVVGWVHGAALFVSKVPDVKIVDASFFRVLAE